MNVKSGPVMHARIAEVSVEKYKESIASVENDCLAIEEPLEIQVSHSENGSAIDSTLSITMRTPGEDSALALGFLFAEGVISSMSDVAHIEEISTGGRDKPFTAELRISLHSQVNVDLTSLQRHFFSTSSCGVCGRVVLDNLPGKKKNSINQQIAPSILHELPNLLRKSQTLFQHTGGIHAAAAFDFDGHLLTLGEDVGRHNALDKVIGKMLNSGLNTPFTEYIVLLSGRVSYELVQKAVMSGIPVIAAIGAPSSLAVEIAGRFGLTLIGFLREHRFNVYTGHERIKSV